VPLRESDREATADRVTQRIVVRAADGKGEHGYSQPGSRAAQPIVGRGTLERHPHLGVAFLEGNCGWVPFLLWRLDEHYEVAFGRAKSALTMKPSEYFKGLCFVSVEADEAFEKETTRSRLNECDDGRDPVPVAEDHRLLQDRLPSGARSPAVA
jgi:hypothetical protein